MEINSNLIFSYSVIELNFYTCSNEVIHTCLSLSINTQNCIKGKHFILIEIIYNVCMMEQIMMEIIC